MKSRANRLLFAGAILLSASACVVGERHRTTIQRQWPAQTIRTVELNGLNGAVKVEAGDVNEVSLVADIQSIGIRPDGRDANKGFFETDMSGDTLRIGERKHRVHIGFPFIVRQKLTIDYTLRVPATVALELRTVNGRITARGVDAATQLTTVNGAIDVEAVGSNELNAKTVNGSVHATFLRDFKGARLKTVNGRVAALLPSSASFTCDLSQVNGDFEASFPLNIHSNPGSRRVSGEVNGGQFELQITTVNGDVEVQHTAAPPKPAAPPVPPAPVS